MKKRIFKWSLFPAIGFLLFSSFGVAACSNSSFKPASVKLNKKEIQMSIGDREVLTASVSKGYEGSELVWISSNESVAYVDGGYVFGVGEGEAYVRAFYGGGNDYCHVTVSDGGSGPVDTPRINLNKNSETIKENGSFTLAVTSIYPTDATVEFRSSDTNIVTLAQIDDKSVTVTGKAEGSTTVTVSGSNGITKV